MKQFNKKILFLALFTILISLSTQAWSQILSPCGTAFLPQVRENTLNYSVPLTLNGAVATTWTLNNKAALELANGGIWDVNNAGIFTISNISPGLNGSTISLNLRATTAAGVSTNGQLSLIILPDIAGEPDILPCVQKFSFVLDASGSMEDLTDLGISKWTRMLEVVKTYWPTLRNAANLGTNGTNHFWDIILFEGNNANEVTSGNFDPTNIDAEITNIANNHVIGGGTPMGGGIQRALTGFLSPPDQAWIQRNIILLTDGMQNRNPMVNDLGTQLVLDGQRGPAGGILGGAFPQTLGTFNTQIFSIGLGTLDMGVETLLKNTSANRYENADSPNLEQFFDTTIPAALENSSPRILDVRRGEIPTDNFGEEKFIVHDSIKSLTLKFIATEGQLSSAQIYVKKDGNFVDVNPVYRNERMKLFHFVFPRDTIFIGAASPKGTWSFAFKDFSPVKYEATAFVDEENIKTRLDFDGVTDFYAGDELPVRLKLTYQGRPITDSATVWAVRLKPGDDLGDIAANTYVNVDSLVLSEQDQSIGEAKIAELSLRPDIIERLKKDSSLINLVYTGNGAYSGVFTGNENTGSYRVIVLVKGNHPNVGPYTGWKARSAVFDFSRPEDIVLHDSIIDLGSGPGGSHNYQVLVTPINKFGKKLGPAQADRLKFVVTAGQIDPLVDQLNGIYTTRVNIPFDSKPNFSAYVANFQQPVLATCLSCVGKPEPALSIPPDITVACDTSVATTGMASIMNSCSPNVHISYSDQVVIDDHIWEYIVQRNWVATDDCGRRLQGVQQIVVNAMSKIKQSLAQKPIVLGYSNSTLTIDSRAVDCIPKWYPATGDTPTGLKNGKQRVDNNCRPGTNLLDKNGRLANPLLAEALRLKLLVLADKNFASRKLSTFPCKIHPVILTSVGSDADVKELLRVTDYALGNIALASNLNELYKTLRCINEYANICGFPGH